MGEIVDFPRKPPGAAQLRAVASQLVGVLYAISDEMNLQVQDMADMTTVAEFADVVHATAEKLREASERWGALSENYP
jgi:hypothetical protein